MTSTPARKGFTRVADIPEEILHDLSYGKIPSATLAECLALNQSLLIHTVFPNLSLASLKAVDETNKLGILKRMESIGTILLNELGIKSIEQCQAHISDTVRGWACFMISAQTDIDLPTRLSLILPFADDEHFAVREWAWMSVRPYLVEDLNTAITLLTPWTTASSDRLRRFTSEVLRPRGVWCRHINKFKQEPELALPILFPLRADPSIYVQNSVANWLNDAAKDKPDWVQELCSEWLQGEPSEATRRICLRAVRNIK